MSHRDLKAPVSHYILRGSRTPNGTRVIGESDGFLEEYVHNPGLFIGERQSRRLKAETGWFEKLVKHAPSVGTFYEDALRTLVAEHLNSDRTIGTGFVFDPLTRSASKQIDLLIFNRSKSSPYYASSNFFIVHPETVVSLSEVKKSLSSNLIRTLIRDTLNHYTGSHQSLPKNANHLHVFSYQCNLSPKTIMKTIASALQAAMRQMSSETQGGHEVRFYQFGITLPCFYFLDMNSFFVTSLDPHKEDDASFALLITEYASHTGDSLPEYLDSMSSNKFSGLNDDSLMSPALRHQVSTVALEDPVFLYQRVSMRELAERFPLDIDQIKSSRCVGSRRPFAAIVPSRYKLEDLSSFSALVGLPGVEWESIPEKVDAPSSQGR